MSISLSLEVSIHVCNVLVSASNYQVGFTRPQHKALFLSDGTRIKHIRLILAMSDITSKIEMEETRTYLHIGVYV